jgi:hypothetical protein
VGIGEKAADIIKDALIEWDKKKTLQYRFSIFREKEPEKKRSTMLDLYERFVEGKKTEEDLEDEAAADAMKKANADISVPVPAK